MLANMLGSQGREIPAGTFIMTGGITEAIDVAAGDNITVRYQHLGRLKRNHLTPTSDNARASHSPRCSRGRNILTMKARQRLSNGLLIRS